MPSFSYDDRRVLQAEQALWIASEILKESAVGAWETRINEARTVLQQIAGEMRNYNDEFETDE